MHKLLLAIGLCFWLSAPLSAQPNYQVLKSQPTAGEVLTDKLHGVRIWFDKPPSEQVSVTIEGGASSIPVQGVHSMGEDDLMGMVQSVLEDGDYVVAWQIGDTRGEIPFKVAKPEDFTADQWEAPLDIGIVLYDGAEPLDVFGPVEMWMNLGPDNARVHFIAEEKRPIVLTTTSYPRELAPRLEAQFSFEDAPDLDVLMVPGGIGTLVEVDNPKMIEYVQKVASEVAVTTSVCTGSAILAKAGLLQNEKATGNKVFFDYIVSQGPADWQLEARWVESGRYFTSSGVSAGIDMSLAVIERFFGNEVAHMIAQSTEYEWNDDPSRDPFVVHANTAVPYVEVLKQRFTAPSSD